MKKIYMMPSIEVTEIELEKLMAGSIGSEGGSYTPSDGGDGGGEVGDDDDLTGNRGSILWDED